MADASNITSYQFFHLLTELPFIEKIYLFGSRARGDNQPRSDIDIAIFCPEATAADWQRVMTIIENADTLLKIDCVRMDELNNQVLLDNIKKNNQLLYEKK